MRYIHINFKSDDGSADMYLECRLLNNKICWPNSNEREFKIIGKEISRKQFELLNKKEEVNNVKE